MKFSQWIMLQETDLPDNILYTACVLHRNSQQYLIGLVDKWMFENTGSGIPRQGWTMRAHHMTIKFRPRQIDLEAVASLFGEEVSLTVTALAWDEYCIAVSVHPGKVLPLGQVPHITIAHSRDVGPVYSNTLLADKSKWKAVSSPELVSFLVGVTNYGIYPNMGSVTLASETM